MVIRRRFRLPCWRGEGCTSLDAGKAVDGDLGGEGEQLAGPVLALSELKKLWRLVNEPRGALAFKKSRVGDHIEQERDIGLHPSNAVFLERSLHPHGCIFEEA